MRDIRECSGRWCGLWGQQAGEISLGGRMSMSLTFRGRRVFGKGKDRDGEFGIVGEYDPEFEEVRLLKSYVGLRVWYTGFWNGQFIAGESTIEAWPAIDYGSFELWPEWEEVALQDFINEAPHSQEVS